MQNPNTNKKINLCELAIEVTRRCNMNCAHCMRGDAQAIDMNPEIVFRFLDQINDIGTIIFTGGEPSLNVKLIQDILRYCKEREICVGDFFLVTNGKTMTDDFLHTMVDWYIYCLEYGNGEYSEIALSRDKFHEEIPRENFLKLKALSFFNEDAKNTDFDRFEPLALGRAKTLSNSRELNWQQYGLDNMDIYDGNDEIIIQSMVCLTANGDVLCDCDYEYKNTDKLKIATYDNFSDTLLFYAEEMHEIVA